MVTLSHVICGRRGWIQIYLFNDGLDVLCMSFVGVHQGKLIHTVFQNTGRTKSTRDLKSNFRLKSISIEFPRCLEMNRSTIFVRLHPRGRHKSSRIVGSRHFHFLITFQVVFCLFAAPTTKTPKVSSESKSRRRLVRRKRTMMALIFANCPHC